MSEGNGAVNFLTAEQILGADDIEYRVVAVPEWGGSVRVRGVSAAERDRWESEIMAADDTDAGRRKRNLATVYFVQMGCVKADGGKLFTVKQVEQLGRKSSKAIGRVFKAILDLSAVSRKELASLLGNSGEADGSEGDGE